MTVAAARGKEIGLLQEPKMEWSQKKKKKKKKKNSNCEGLQTKFSL